MDRNVNSRDNTEHGNNDKETKQVFSSAVDTCDHLRSTSVSTTTTTTITTTAKTAPSSSRAMPTAVLKPEVATTDSPPFGQSAEKPRPCAEIPAEIPAETKVAANLHAGDRRSVRSTLCTNDAALALCQKTNGEVQVEREEGVQEEDDRDATTRTAMYFSALGVTDPGMAHADKELKVESAPKHCVTSSSVISAHWLLDRASAWLAKNKGARCPYRVAIESIGRQIEAELRRRGVPEDSLQLERAAAVDKARSLPEVACTLVMCDLCVPCARSLLTYVRTRLVGASPSSSPSSCSSSAAAAGVAARTDDTAEEHRASRWPTTFHDMTEAFSLASVAKKRTDDVAPYYCAEWSDTAAGHRRVYYFSNEATYLAYRYFGRASWVDLPNVPADWARPLPVGMSAWIDVTSRLRDLSLSLPQYRLCMPPRKSVGAFPDGVQTRPRDMTQRSDDKPHLTRSRSSKRNPPGDTHVWPRHSRPGPPVQLPSQKSESHALRRAMHSDLSSYPDPVHATTPSTAASRHAPVRSWSGIVFDRRTDKSDGRPYRDADGGSFTDFCY